MPETSRKGVRHEEPGNLNTPSAKEIIRRIKEGGPVTFAEFMDIALYWPDGGYYTSPVEKGGKPWGSEGDYITSIDVSPVFSRAVSKEIFEMWVCLGSPPSFELVEAGAGRGGLSKGILESLKELHPGLYGIIKVRLVEKNPFLRQPSDDKITWHSDISEIKAPLTGCVLSNELIDSFPVHRVVWDGGLSELYAGFDGSSLIDVIGPPSTGELLSYFEDLRIEPPRGNILEVNLKAKEWIREAARLLTKGFVLTIDYGLPARELYSPERRAGTLLCHFRHTLNDNPYINIGSQDITTHVDFTTLAREGEKSGLALTGFTTQKNFLLSLGILEELKKSETLSSEDYEKIRANRALASLIMPGGMGDTFKVMVQHNGIEGPSLSGFSFKDMRAYL